MRVELSSKSLGYTIFHCDHSASEVQRVESVTRLSEKGKRVTGPTELRAGQSESYDLEFCCSLNITVPSSELRSVPSFRLCASLFL